ncbi:MAG TPA: hypothetical protein DCO77_12585 [Nitrospiraceae bacterium]|nr:hypothetical protein [Nitrospiraceae bacterium]
MNSNELKDMGIVEERAAETTEVAAHVKRAERDLATSRLLLDNNDEEWAFAAAYQVMARSARGLILSEGFRPKSVRGRDPHKIVVTAVGAILGPKHKSMINKFDRMRRKYQNVMEEAGTVISRYEARQALKDAEEFFALAGERIKEKYSQMSFLNGAPQSVSR